MRNRIVPLAAILTAAMLTSASAQAPQPRRSETALDRYVAAPDANFAWKVLRDLPVEGATATLLEMTSQKWLTEKEVERPLWTHWLTVVRPASVTSDIGFLFITGGSLDRQPPARPPAWMIDLARDTGTVVTELRLVPNQPIVFVDDPQRKPRTEDDYIAYTWDKFLRTGDEKWPARLPMTKSAVRAMDAVTAFAASREGGESKVARFVVAGGSKRGWTTWTTAAVDRRVVAIVPMVIDLLNVEKSFEHHWRAYGAWSNAVDDYVEHRIMEWMGTPQFRALMKIEEPYEYRDRLTMPKFLVNASGDQFFLPDSSQFYFDDLRGEKQLRYVPNTGHSLDKSDAIESVHAFYASVVSGTRRPEVKWTFERDGSIKVTTKERPEEVRLWQATNPKARNFRLDVLGPAYTSTVLQPSGPNTWIARMPQPAGGWTAFFVETTFASGGKYPFKVTSGVRVVPDTLPYPPPKRGSEPMAQAPAPIAKRLVGAWRMLSFESFDQSGTARPGNYDVGMIVYDVSGRMSAHLMHSSNKASGPLAADADRAAAYRRYLGYWGPFTVDEAKGVVVHRVEGSSNPSWVGSDQVRHFVLAPDGEKLTLSVKNGDRVTSTLVWERIR